MKKFVTELEKDVDRLKELSNDTKNDLEEFKYEYEKIDCAETYVKILKLYNKKFDMYVDVFTRFIDEMLEFTGTYKNEMKKLLEVKNSAYVLNQLNICDKSEDLLKSYRKQFSIYKDLISSYMEIFEFSSDDATLIRRCEEFVKNDFIETLEDFVEDARNFDEDQYSIAKNLDWTE